MGTKIKFVIVTNPRTGTKRLFDLLNAHSEGSLSNDYKLRRLLDKKHSYYYAS